MDAGDHAKHRLFLCLPLVIAHVVDVRQDHQGHASLRVQSLSEAGVEPRAVHHHVASGSLLMQRPVRASEQGARKQAFTTAGHLKYVVTNECSLGLLRPTKLLPFP